MLRHALPGLFALALAVLTGCREPEIVASPPRPAVAVQPQSAQAQVQSYPGEVRARFEPELAFRIGGKVSKRMVDAGERVREGQALAELDPEDVRLQLEAARAQVAAAQANLQLAKTERDRYSTLLERQMISSSQFDNADNTYRSAAARLKQARAEFDVADNQATYSILRAPQNGVITRRAVEVGQVIAAGQTVFVLAADGEREALISLPESSIGHILIGQTVEVELWSRPEERFVGTLRELSPAADPQSRTFAARVSFDADEQRVEVGQSARVFIHQPDQVALAVPLSAVSSEQQQRFVWVIDPQTHSVVRTPVRMGAYGQDQVTILDGLTADDWVVAAGVHMLIEGQTVRPVDRQNRNVMVAGE